MPGKGVEEEVADDSRHPIEASLQASARQFAMSAILLATGTVAASCAAAFWIPWRFGSAAIAAVLIIAAFGFLYRSYRNTHDAAAEAIWARRESEERFRDLYHNTPVMMHSIDRTGQIVEVNDHWLKTLRYPREEVLGYPGIDFLTPASKRYAQEVAIPELLEKGIAEDVSYQMVTRDGHILDVSLSASTERDEDGQILRSRAMIVDVTALKRAEREREQTIRQLESKNEELERFTYTVSHDLKSPLATIRGYAGMLARDAEKNPERLRADLGQIEQAIELLAELLDGLLELSRAGQVIRKPKEVDLAGVVRDAAIMLSGGLGEHDVELEIDPELGTALCDAVRLRQVFQNLIENAIKFRRDGIRPRIEVGRRSPDHDHSSDRGSSSGAETVYFVCDNGVGLDPADAENILQPFQKLDPDIPGYGIGLALVRRVVEVHGGRVWIESAGRGEGATACFTLPRSRILTSP